MDPYEEGDRKEAEILASNPEADPFELGYLEDQDENGVWCWVRDDGKRVYANSGRSDLQV